MITSITTSGEPIFPLFVTVTYSYDRHKYHKTLSNAKSAVSRSTHRTCPGADIWAYEDGKWILKYEIAPGTAYKDFPWRKEKKEKQVKPGERNI